MDAKKIGQNKKNEKKNIQKFFFGDPQNSRNREEFTKLKLETE